jgi:hypothetical protein
VAAQFLSCIYYGVFLITLWPLLAVVEWLRRRGRVPIRIVMHAGAALALAGVVAGAYSLPYQRARQQVGDRGDTEVERYSGGFDSYALSPAQSRLWGWTQAAGRSERWLFPGLLGSALAVSAVTTPAAPWVAAVAVTGVVSADASRGSAGVVYPVLRSFLSPYRGLRVPARFGMLTLTMLALLTAIGCGTMGRAFAEQPKAGVLAALVLLFMGVETLANVPVREMPKTPPPVYTFLGTLPPTVIAHAPLPRADRLPGFEADFIYFAQYHRHEVVNGNSGFYPPNYLRLLAETRNLPGNRSIAALRQAGVEYLLVHDRSSSTPEDAGRAIFELEARGDIDPVGTWADEPGRGDVRVYRLRRE